MKRTFKKWVHMTCRGDIDLKTRSCLKCKKKWSWMGFYITDATGMRLMTFKIPNLPPPKTTKYASWGDKLPYIGEIASKLPNWPTWARIISLLIFLGLLTLVVTLIYGAFTNG